MATNATEIPIELLNPGAKFKTIEWIRAQGFPSRVARGLLDGWGIAVGVELNATDYELVSMKEGL